MQTPLPLSVAIITLNEADNLPRCLESVRELAGEIIVVDSGSKDSTEAIAKQYGAQFQIKPWQGYVVQKNFALQACSQPWVLCLDADEALSPDLQETLRQTFALGDPKECGFWVNRHSFYLGRWIDHAWYPEWRLRLVRRPTARWGGLDPHDKLEVIGPTARLSGDLFHYPFRNLQDHLHSSIQHARTMADSYARTGKVLRWYHLPISPWLAFLKRLVLKQAWRDGWRGWIISFVNILDVFAKYAFLLEKKMAAKDSPPHS